MAHYKRKKSRAQQNRHYSSNGLKYRLGDRYETYCWFRNYPRSWDIIMHTRPARRACKANEVAILKGEDADNMVWPDNKKPHSYYW